MTSNDGRAERYHRITLALDLPVDREVSELIRVVEDLGGRNIVVLRP